jgi:hypothetical protein
MDIRQTIDIGVPSRWIVCFSRVGAGKWFDAFAFGRHKHARAFGYVTGMGIWIFYDVHHGKTTLGIVRDGTEACKLAMAAWMADADVIGIDASPTGHPSTFTRLGWWCAPAIRHLIGLPACALPWPSRLHRDCLRYGGVAISDADPAGCERPLSGAGAAVGGNRPAAGAAGAGAG